MAGTGCASAGRTVARCRVNGDLGLTRVLLGDLDDTARVAGNDQSVHFDGGAGDDSLRGGRGNDAIEFGDGPVDTLVGGPGNDVLRGASAGVTRMPADSGPDGRDVYVGGKGVDTVSYAARRGPLSFRFNAAADDGAAGEGDRIGARIDNLVAGDGADRLTGDSKGQGLHGGPGRDVIRAGGGPTC